MTNKNKINILLAFFACACLATVYFKNSNWEEAYYDWNHNNPTKLEEAHIDSILSTFKTLDINGLPKEYSNKAQITNREFLKLTKNTVYYELTREQAQQKIVGKHRIKEFLCKDERWHSSSLFSDTKLYLGLDKRILYRLLRLKERLKRLGYNQDGIIIKSGYRTPLRNIKVRGASRSRHMAGEAIDLEISDVNKDGKYTLEDKKIVLDLCENFVIRNMGGIGLYPNTRIVHLDVRGHRARWNSY